MMTRFRRLPSRSALPLAIGVLLVCSVGCGKTGTVKGIVKQADGTPLPGGLIMFVPEEAGKSSATGVIKEDGTYEVEVPKGAFKVSIDNRAAGQVETLVGVGGLTGSGSLAVGRRRLLGAWGWGGRVGLGGLRVGLRWRLRHGPSFSLITSWPTCTSTG